MPRGDIKVAGFDWLLELCMCTCIYVVTTKQPSLASLTTTESKMIWSALFSALLLEYQNLVQPINTLQPIDYIRTIESHFHCSYFII